MKENIEEDLDYDPYFDGKAKSLQEICYRCGLGRKAMVKWIKNNVPGVVYTDKRKR